MPKSISKKLSKIVDKLLSKDEIVEVIPEEVVEDKIKEEPISLKPIEISEKVKEKYSFERNTFSAILKDNPKDLVKVEVGDAKQDDFYPQVKSQRWDNEVNFSARLVHNEKNPVVSTDGDKIKWKGKKIEANFYNIEPCEEHPEGGYEFDITLFSKPDTNVIQFTLQTKGLDFFYQPELTEQEIKDGVSRPDNVVGSYAVYAKTQKTNYTDGKEYKCGKVGHIFRPKICDSVGSWVWGELNVDVEKGILSVTIPQMFLVRAVYPVRHAAGLTFGYTTAGASTFQIASDVKNGIGGSKFTLTEAASAVSSMTATLKNGGTGSLTKIKFGLYNTGITKLDETNLITQSIGSWTQHTETINLNTGGSKSAADYWLVMLATGSAQAGVYLYYDAGSAGQGGSTNLATNDTALPATWSPTTSTKKHSIYATYTASGGGTAWNKSLADTVTPSDAVSKGLTIRKSDSTSIVDNQSSSGGSNVARADTVSTTDTIKKTTTLAEADTVTLTDLASLRPVKKLSDTVTPSDATAKSFHLFNTDSVTVTDQPTVAGTLYQNISDSISVSDSIATKRLVISKTDSTTTSDGISKALVLSKSDTGTATDSNSKTIHTIQSESVSIAESANTNFLSGQHTQALSDSANVSDVATPTTFYNLSLNDGITLSDDTSNSSIHYTGNYMVYEGGKLKIIVNGALVQQYG